MCSKSNSTDLQCVQFVFKLCLVIKKLLVELLFVLLQLFLRLLHLVHNTSRPCQCIPARNRDGEEGGEEDKRKEEEKRRRREGEKEEEVKEEMRRKKEERRGGGKGREWKRRRF